MIDNVKPFDILRSQLQCVVDRMDALGMVGAVLSKDGFIMSGFSGQLTTSEACEMICRLIQFIFEDKLEDGLLKS